MRFDYTHGQDANYVVSAYREMTDDHYYVHSMKQAKELFKRLEAEEKKGVAISIYDLHKDIRKQFVKL